MEGASKETLVEKWDEMLEDKPAGTSIKRPRAESMTDAISPKRQRVESIARNTTDDTSLKRQRGDEKEYVIQPKKRRIESAGDEPEGEPEKKSRKRQRVEQSKHKPTEDFDFWKRSLRTIICSSALNNVNLTEHHTNSFDDLTTTWLKDIILTHGNISTVFGSKKYQTFLSDYKFVRGTILPSDAHLFNVSYTAHVLITVHEFNVTSEYPGAGAVSSGDPEYPWVIKDTRHVDCRISDFPIMLSSLNCHLRVGNDNKDQTEPEWGGGFIVAKGKRRCIPMLKTLANNVPYLFRNKKYLFVQVRSEHLARQHRSTSSIEVAIDESKSKISTLFYNVYVNVPFLKPTLPLPILLLALGCDIEKFIDLINTRFIPRWKVNTRYKKYIIMLRNDNRGCTTADDALGFINKLYGRPETASTAKLTVQNEILPHLNEQEDVEFSKVYYLAYVYGLLIRYKEGILSQTDRDSYEHTRLTTSGTSLAILFRAQFKLSMQQAVKYMRRLLVQNKEILMSKVYNYTRINKKLMGAISSGHWSAKRKGISHQMTTTNKDAIISQLRRVTSSYLNNDGRHITPRMVKSDGMGYICAAETPEGPGCGLVYALASTCRVTRASDHDALMELLILEFGENFSPLRSWDDVLPPCYTFFDTHGRPVGYIHDIDCAVKKFVSLRRSLTIDYMVTYSKNKKLQEFRVFCDVGRLTRPLIVVTNMYKIPDIVRACVDQSRLFRTLLANGCIEYVSAGEEKTLRTTFDFADLFQEGNDYTHIEITDVSFVGIVAALSPLFRHNQGPRLVYWIGMSKQAICCTPQNDLGSSTTHSLWYGHKPSCATATARMLNMDQVATCINCTVIFYPLDYNQEDAIIMNQASIDKGMFISDSIRTYDTCRQGSKNETNGELFEKPKKGNTYGMKLGSYDVIQSDGLARPNARVKGNDIITGKTVPGKKISNTALVNAPAQLRSAEHQRKRCDRSTQVRPDEAGTVTEVILAKKENSHLAKVRVATTRIPKVGDKFSSRHSQKGTIGNIYKQEDMPFSMATGMVPDIVMTPWGFPSRMTMGKLLEILLGKAVCVTGDIMQGIDEQFFDEPAEVQMAKFQEILRKHGYAGSGKELFADGKSGKPIECLVMHGVVSYVKLNHMVERKGYARATGPVHILTRQPNGGRRNGGGQKIGLMELECIIAHAGSEILRERTLSVADEFKLYICGDCGFVADGNKHINLFFCRFCKTREHMRTVVMPYTTKLLVQEQAATGVKIKLCLTDQE